MGHKGCSLMEGPTSFHQLLQRSARVSLHIHQKPFVRCERLGRQFVGLSSLCHRVGQRCECIWEKPAFHHRWASGAGGPLRLLQTCSATCGRWASTEKSQACCMGSTTYTLKWTVEWTHLPALPAVLAAEESCESDRHCLLGWGYGCLVALERVLLAYWWSEYFWTHTELNFHTMNSLQITNILKCWFLFQIQTCYVFLNAKGKYLLCANYLFNP